jgi:ubiquinone biosynthesis protein COQ9
MTNTENQQNLIENAPSSAGDGPDLRLTRDRLIVALLPHVMFDGWTGRALSQAAQEIGCDPLLAERLFPQGARDMVAHFVDLSDRLTVEDAKALTLEGLSDKARLLKVLDLHFARWAPYREAVKRALGVLAMPNNLALAAKASWSTADAIWLAAGKSVHDFSWYTRRASLAAVYGATVLVWLGDPTPDLSDTHAFLARRMDDVGAAIKFRKRIQSAIIPDRIRHRLFG